MDVVVAIFIIIIFVIISLRGLRWWHRGCGWVCRGASRWVRVRRWWLAAVEFSDGLNAKTLLLTVLTVSFHLS